MTISRGQLEVLCAIAREAGAAIMNVYAAPVAVTAKADLSPLTEADVRADSIIRTRLEAAFPGVFILSEESVSASEAAPDGPFFLVDPLDGTREFLNHNGEFTVNIALIDGEVKAGVVYAPVPDQLYFAARELGAFWQDGAAPPLQVGVGAAPAESSALRIVGSRSHGTDELPLWQEGLGRPTRFESVGSSLKFCLIARGAADLYPRYGLTSQWDTAAGQCVLECAGGQVMDHDGRRLHYALDRPIHNPPYVAFGPAGLREDALRAIAFVRERQIPHRDVPKADAAKAAASQ